MKLYRAQRIIAAAERDAILGISSSYELGGIESFTGLDVGRLNILLAAGHADPFERHNDGPSIDEFAKFLTAHPRFTAHGYAVGPDRYDYRLSIEGVELKAQPTDEERSAFDALFYQADERMCSNKGLYCWYD
jgi:hypothetical protein